MCNRKMAGWGFVALLLVLPFRESNADVVITGALEPDALPRIEGRTTEARMAYSPASTFKMIIALVAFEQGIATPETRMTVNDRHLPARPMGLNFEKAMYYSSNEFFVNLMEKMTNEQIVEMAEKCGFGKPTGKMPKNKADWRYGATFKVTPLQEYEFLRKLAFGKLPVSKKAQSDLIRVMRWLSKIEGAQYFAKSGSWDRTYWMSGLAALGTGESTSYEVIVVMLRDKGANRKKAIAKFEETVKAAVERHKAARASAAANR